MSQPRDGRIRLATMADVSRLRELIVISARALSRGYYDDTQIEAALAFIFGVDTTLIEDGTYFLAEADGALLGSGGWSKRRTLFGGDQYGARDSELLDPTQDAAKIRAFFIHPEHARRGLGRALLARCEHEARACGFQSAELMSTLPGMGFYARCGYHGGPPQAFQVTEETTLQFVPMTKCF